MLSAAAVHAQERGPSDRSLAQSLLAVSFPAPSAPIWRGDTTAEEHGRYELAYGRALRAGAGGLRQTVVVHLRSEQHGSRDSGQAVGVGGARLGLRAADREGKPVVSGAEVYIGGRFTPRADGLSPPTAGFDLVVGWGGIGDDTRASLAMRFPVEQVFETTGARFSLFAAPAMGWGHLRMRACEDNGPGDNCGDLGVQLAFGRTRFAVAAGASVTALPARLSVAAGIQRLFAVGETERAWVGGSLTH